MFVSPQIRSHRAFISRRAAAAVAAVLGLTALAVLALAPVASAGPAKGGVVDMRLESMFGVEGYGLSQSDIPALVDEIASPSRLGAQWTRVLVHWSELQPDKPAGATVSHVGGAGYDAAYLAELDAVVSAFHDRGVNVILTGADVPRWASNRTYWRGGVYDNDAAMKIDDTLVRGQFAAFATFLAQHFGALGVRYFEVWNEPNLGSGIYPQTLKRKIIGPAVYVKMLKAFYAGAKRGASTAFVIAGATAPRGTGNDTSTSPQAFATYLMDQRAGRYFNGYSHHPYTPRGSRLAAPGQLPNNPKLCVTLGNLKTLLAIVPKKPFFLTEIGYGTQDSDLFGLTVTREQQAAYLTQAYQLVAGNSRVKAMLWYLVTDWQPLPSRPTDGAYTGLVGVDGLRKPAWYAFAGGNSMMLTPPAPPVAGAQFTLSGMLMGKVPVDAGQSVVLQSRPAGGSAWTAVATQKSAADGAFSFDVSQTQDTDYRVLWDGVGSISEPLPVTMATP